MNLKCNDCPDSILELDTKHRGRGHSFDRYVCPTCKTSFPEATARRMNGEPETLLDLARRDPMDPRVPAWLSVKAQAAETPLGREVTKEVFFAKVGPMNVHPRSEPDASYWETPNRQLVGTSTPGYMGGTDQRYFLNGAES